MMEWKVAPAGPGSDVEPQRVLEGFLEHAPTAFQLLRRDGRCLLVNRAFRELFGDAPALDYNVFQDDALARLGFRELIDRAFAGETVQLPAHWLDRLPLRHSEVRERRRVRVEVTCFPVVGDAGDVRQVALCYADLTAEAEREREQERWRGLEQELAATLHSIGDAVIATDMDGRVVRMNPVAEVLTGWTLLEAAGRPLADIFCVVDEDTRLPVENPVDRVLREGVVVGLANHTALVSRSGTECAIADSGAPIRDAGGTIRGVVLVFRDQTEERRVERALRESEARKAAVLEAALDCIVTIDHTGSITEFNPAAEATFGYQRSEVVGKQLSDLLVPPALRERHRQGFQRYLETGDAKILGRRLELPAVRADGSEFPIELAIVRIRSEGPPMFTGYIRELSERKRGEEAKAKLAAEARAESASRSQAERALLHAEEQLRQSQKIEAIGKLAGGIAHDFNNLLSVVKSYTVLLLDELRPGQPMHEELTQVLEASERATNLTRQLLAFSRQQVMSPRVLDLNEVIERMSKMLPRMIGEDIELAFALRAKEQIRVDQGQIEQVLLNLLVNARDAMPGGGKLMVETDDVALEGEYANAQLGVLPGRYVVLSVSDSGEGMDEATRERIFEPFFTTKEQGKGTGLGLATVFGIVKQSGGHIWVYSEPGQGATFKVYLPRSQHASQRPEAAEKAAAQLHGTETILLVEDDDQVRRLTNRVLQKYGYKVLEAPTVGEAMLICERHEGAIDAMLTDVVMPRMNGRQLAERVAPLRPSMRIIFMSGYTKDAIIHRDVLNAGIAFVQKPIMPEPLLTTLREVLDAKGE